MSSKISYLITTTLVTAVLLVGIALFLGRAPQVASPESQSPTLSSDTIKSSSSQTKNLKNFGNLPATVGANEIGRDNPFNSY